MSFRQVFSNRSFAYMWGQRLFANIAMLMQGVTVGWQVYTVARQSHDVEWSAFIVGMIGLVQFLPFMIVSLFAGQMADQYDRRKILMLGIIGQVVCAICFGIVALQTSPSLTLLFVVSAVFSGARSFLVPASAALVPMLVSKEILPKAVAWSSLAQQFGRAVGPALGGILCAVSPSLSYFVAAFVFGLTWLCAYLIKGDTMPKNKQGATRLVMIKEGLSYLWTNKVLLGATTLDLFAVLLGGVTALLPVYARDILKVGPDGFGMLRSAPAVGSMLALSILALKPIHRHTGPWMLLSIVVYGIATVIFALSGYLALSLLMLVILGAADSVSLFVRQTLVQVVTPDYMRGRISSVSSMFISTSTELGEFESGVLAKLAGPIGSAVIGGVGSVLIAALWAKLFPALRKTDKLAPEDVY